MAYYLSDQREDDVVGAYRRYQNYLKENREKFPPGALALATADWYYNPSDHRSPHDAWLEDLRVVEAGDENQRNRTSSITIRLLGAFHDGHIEISYPRIFGFEMKSISVEHRLGDWLYDE